MSSDYERQISELVQKAYMMDGTDAEVGLLEEAIQLADAHNDLEKGFQLRVSLIQAATFAGFPEKVMVAFTWCLAQCDKAPDLGGGRTFDERRLLWQSKWAMHCLTEFPHVSRAQFDKVTNDMAERYKRAGASLRPIHKLRCGAAIDFRDPEAAKAEFPLWTKAKSDWNSDCKACDSDSQVEYWAFMGEPEEALKAAVPILEKKQRCAEVPHTTYGVVLAPLLQLGRTEEAVAYHHTGLRLVNGRRELIRTVARHVEFMALTDNWKEALKVVQRNWAIVLENVTPFRRLDFEGAALLAFERGAIMSKSGVEKLRLPPSFPDYVDAGTYNLAKVADVLRERCRPLAKAFDLRNGNAWHQGQLDAVPERVKDLKHVPLGPKKKAGTKAKVAAPSEETARPLPSGPGQPIES